jgi:DNA polymerase I
MKPKKLFIIDAMALAFRSHHGLSRNPLYRSSDKFPTSAIYGSALFLIKLIEREQPDFLLIATDSKEKTFRHKLFPEYKANRKKMPEELGQQIPLIYELFKKFGITIFKQDGYEADDIIGTITNELKTTDIECYIVSGDKDFAQLVSPKTFLYTTKKGGIIEILGPEQVIEKFGCSPKHIIDYLAIMGDSADNISGVPGIGAKGAEKLIKENGTLEDIYNNIDSISNKRLQKKLEENKKTAFFSKELVTIYKKVPLDLDKFLNDYKKEYKKILEQQTLWNFLKEFEFNSLANRIKIKEQKFVSQKKEDLKTLTRKDQDKRNYCFINTKEKLEQFFSEVSHAKKISLHLTSSGISLCYSPYDAYFIPLCENEAHTLNIEQTISKLNTLFSLPDKIYINTEIKPLLHSLKKLEITLNGKFLDNSLMHHLLDSQIKYQEEQAYCDYLSLTTNPQPQENDLDILSYYSCERSDLNFRINQKFSQKLQEENLLEVYNSIEEPLIYILFNMEQEGILIDLNNLEKISQKIQDLQQILQQEIISLAGKEFNLNSPKQLQEVIYNDLKIHEKLGVSKIKKTTSGYSTDNQSLKLLKDEAIIEKMIKYRSLSKLLSTYGRTLPNHVNSTTGRIHSTFKQTGTATGRLSSVNPNLQNIPIKDSWGQQIRNQFKAKKGHILISADYSQIELRVMAHMSEDSQMVMAFLQNKDIHNFIATKIFQKPECEISKQERSHAKTINYGIIYGMGATRLAGETGLSAQQAQEFIEKYFSEFPDIKIFSQKTIQQAQAQGTTSTITGRKRTLSRSNHSEQISANSAINSPIQGSASDLLKIAMININLDLKKNKYNCKLILQIHDELLFECHQDFVEQVIPLIKKHMENSYTLKVPLIANIGTGNSWLEAHP